MWKLTSVGLLMFVGIGCSAAVRFVPPGPRPVTPPTRFVRLEVVDARPAEFGGDDRTAVGVLRGGYGNPFTLSQENPNDVAEVVREAVEDALLRAGVGIKPDAPTALVARIGCFWIDGYAGYAAQVEVDYLIAGPSGEPIWTTHVIGTAEDTIASASGASELLGQALADASVKSSFEFSAQTFVNSIR